MPGPVPCTPLRFFIWSLSLLINFKICFRDLMSWRRHPPVSPRWMCLKVFPLWSAEFKGLRLHFPDWCSIEVFALSSFSLHQGSWWSKSQILITLLIYKSKRCCQQLKYDSTISQFCSVSTSSALQRHGSVRWILLWKEVMLLNRITDVPKVQLLHEEKQLVNRVFVCDFLLFFSWII